jgi:hypothetical protein
MFGSFSHRPRLDHHPHQSTPTVQPERRVTVQLHPASSLDWGFATTSLQGRPDEQRAQELQLATRLKLPVVHTDSYC